MNNKKLRVLRYLSGKSQDELAVLTGLSQSKISRIERGYIQPKPEDKKIIAKILDVSTEQLFPKK